MANIRRCQFTSTRVQLAISHLNLFPAYDVFVFFNAQLFNLSVVPIILMAISDQLLFRSSNELTTTVRPFLMPAHPRWLTNILISAVVLCFFHHHSAYQCRLHRECEIVGLVQDLQGCEIKRLGPQLCNRVHIHMWVLSAACTLAVFCQHETFGSNSECNSAAKMFEEFTFRNDNDVSHGGQRSVPIGPRRGGQIRFLPGQNRLHLKVHRLIIQIAASRVFVWP